MILFWLYLSGLSNRIIRKNVSSLKTEASLHPLNLPFRYTNNKSYFLQKTELDITNKFSAVETICMKYQSLFPGKKRYENVFTMSSVEKITRHA